MKPLTLEPSTLDVGTTPRRRWLHQLAALALAGPVCAQAWAAAATPVPVVVSFSILDDLVRQVGGTRVQVHSLVGPGGDAHTYQPRPSDAQALKRARLFVINGLGFEPWATRLAQSARYSGVTLVASTGIQPRHLDDEPAAHDHGHDDPHAWQDPRNVLRYVDNIAQALSALDPAGATAYADRAKAYRAQILEFDARAETALSAIPPTQRKVISSHDAFGYLAARYGITWLAAEGVNPEAEPSARHVAALVRQIQREKIRAVFVEALRNPRLIRQLSRDAGVTPGPELYADTLSAADGPAPTWLAMMEHNLKALRAGMAQNPR
ncbi:MAG: metal ABC transporter substrate-binding protein [Rhodoferax sp.]